MYVKHFFKMLFGLVGMALIGVAGLVLTNHYFGAKGTSADTLIQQTSSKTK